MVSIGSTWKILVKHQLIFSWEVPKNFTKFSGSHLCWSLFFNSFRSKVFSCEFWEIFKITLFVKHFWMTAFENHVHLDLIVYAITDTIYWNNFLTYQPLILLYYFHQKIVKEKTAIFKKCNFFGQACFCAQRPLQIKLTYIFSSCNIMN